MYLFYYNCFNFTIEWTILSYVFFFNAVLSFCVRLNSVIYDAVFNDFKTKISKYNNAFNEVTILQRIYMLHITNKN